MVRNQSYNYFKDTPRALCPVQSAEKSKMIGNGIVPKSGSSATINSFRIHKCSNEYNRKNRIPIKCVHDSKINDEIKKL